MPNNQYMAECCPEPTGKVEHKKASRTQSIFYCSHVMDVVERLCDRLAILSHGVILASGSFEELKSSGEAHTLERLFTQLTGAGDHEAVAEEVVRVLASEIV